MKTRDILKRLHDRPFKPFRVHLSDGTMLDVPEPGMVIVGESSAVLPSRFGRDPEGYRFARNWRTVALSHMVQFTDLDETVNGKSRRKK